MGLRLRQFWFWVTGTYLRMLVAAFVALAAAGGIAYGVHRLLNPSPSCGSPGVYHVSGSRACVGVTDGRYDFLPSLHAVDQAILAEDDRVGRGSAATLAVLLPLDDPDAASRSETLHLVEGAYLAQYQADELSGRSLKIRLVLANPGVGSARWRQVADQLKGMAAAPDDLRAVTGIDVSTSTTHDELSYLTQQGIPVVTGPVTADSMANSDADSTTFPGLARIAPTNTAEAAALKHVTNVDPAQALLVEDARTGDDYITTLKQAFQSEITQAPYQPVQFTSTGNVNAEGSTEDTFAVDTTNICQQGPKSIFFAGRHVQLRQFLNELGKNCPTRAFTVLTGSDASYLSNDTALDDAVFGPQRITLEYAALATPAQWASPQNATWAAGYQDFLAANQAAFPKDAQLTPAQLTDGDALIGHDMVWTAFQAISQLIGVKQLPAGQFPALADIGGWWHNMRAAYRVYGASGWICLNNGGNPYDKAVPIVAYDQSGPRYVQLAWPRGTPPNATCSN